MLYVDVKYLNLISHRFELFKERMTTSSMSGVHSAVTHRKKNKMRGYFFCKDNGMIYKCHNCGYGSSFGNVLKQLDPISYKEYSLEKFTDEQKKTGNRRGQTGLQTVTSYSMNSRNQSSQRFALAQRKNDQRVNWTPEIRYYNG